MSQPPVGPQPFVDLQDITRIFGATRANDDIGLTIARGQLIGLIGGNGAGKSTLMKVLCGVVPPTSGRIVIDGADLTSCYGPAQAQARGIRIVHQELSLCTNLTVAENFFVEAPESLAPTPGWRRIYRDRAQGALNAVFPGSGISPDSVLGRLTIGERQMVEIARAAATPGVRLLILDEPTSSLSAERARQLIAFLHGRAAEGLAVIFISHKLKEIIDIAHRVVLLRNGRNVWEGHAEETSVPHLIGLMGGSAAAASARANVAAGKASVTVGPRWIGGGTTLRDGQITALSGLEGSGQHDFLIALHGRGEGISRQAECAFVAGDRQKEGIFPLWSVLSNIAIGRIAARGALARVDGRAEAEAAAPACNRLLLDKGRMQSRITDLSGGNQQKALVARALATEAPVVLLDDPTRGVDIATKQSFYPLLRDLAQMGKTLVWHTTEDAELDMADRVLVFAGGRIVADLEGEAITPAAVLEASFQGSGAALAEGQSTLARIGRAAAVALPYASLLIVLALMYNANPLTLSRFGIELLLTPAVALVLIALAQMFIIGGSEVDLGTGAFAALISVLAATVLFQSPALGIGGIALALAAYAGIGGLIQWRGIPAIVVTLGASFIWLGIGFSVQPTPGGTAPAWVSAAVRWKVAGLPTPVILIAAATALGFWIDRSPLGVTLRGFGNNTRAMQLSGWSPVRFGIVRYAIAGIFAALAGFVLTGINAASDINAGNAFTLQSVAAVVMGGAALIGGVISPLGTTVGAVTLALLAALLGMLNVPNLYNPATQGTLLLVILALRSLTARAKERE